MRVSIDWVERWRALANARHEQGRRLDRLHDRPDVWSHGRARRFDRAAHAHALADPLLDRLLVVGAGRTILEVGPGPGRHTVPLARVARRVIAVEPSVAMRENLATNLAAAGVENVTVVAGGWPACASAVGPVDLALCAHVLYPVVEVAPFLDALHAIARETILCQMHFGQRDGPYRDLFRAIWDEDRCPAPGVLDLFNVAHALGYAAEFALAPAPAFRTFPTFESALEIALQDTLNPEGQRAQDLAVAFLRERLQRQGDGFALTTDSPRSGIVSWRGGAER